MKISVKIIITLLCVLIGFSVIFFGKNLLNNKSSNKKNDVKTNKIDITSNYNDYVIATTDTDIYNKKLKKIGKIYKDTKILLDDKKNIKDKYYKLKNADIYIKYDSVTKSDAFTYENEYKTYKNYIVYNENIKTKSNYKLLNGDNTLYEFNNSDTYKIIIKDEDKYGIEFNDQLFYIKSEDVESNMESANSDNAIAKDIAVLNYHYTIDKNSDEGKECRQTICMDQNQVEEEIKYLKDNNFYPVTMQDLYLFLTGKIKKKKKSVSITIDDGWYLTRMISILENNGSHGGGLLCLDEQTILDDLKKSRESLNNTDILCYPFYEYNARTIELVKKAGFKMALAGGYRKAKPGDNIYAVPRFELGNYTTMNDFVNAVN